MSYRLPRINSVVISLLVASLALASFLTQVAVSTKAQTTGRQFYVSPAGSDSNPGSLSQPFKTVQKAISLGLQPGDTILLRTGQYPPFVLTNVQGTSTAPITIKSYPGERATVDMYLTPAGQERMIKLDGTTSYIVFDSFDVVNSNPTIDNLWKLNLKVQADFDQYKAAYPTVNSYAIRAERGSDGVPRVNHITVQHITAHHIIGQAFSGVSNYTQYLNNLAYDIQGYGWYSSGDHQLYSGNIVHDAVMGLHLYDDPSASVYSPITNSIIDGNFSYHNGYRQFYHPSGRPVPDTGGWGLLVFPGTGNIVRNNIVANNTWGVLIGSLHMYNNTIVGSQSPTVQLQGGASDVRHNLFAPPSGTAEIVNNSSGSTLTENLTAADPKFVNASANNYHLQSGSPASDLYSILSEVPDDYDGLARPQGTKVDAGAYEYTTIASSPSPSASLVPVPSPTTSVGASPLTSPLSVIKTVDKATTVSGDILTYTITIKNTSTVTISPIRASDVIPFGTTFVSASDNGHLATDTIIWHLISGLAPVLITVVNSQPCQE